MRSRYTDYAHTCPSPTRSALSRFKHAPDPVHSLFAPVLAVVSRAHASEQRETIEKTSDGVPSTWYRLPGYQRVVTEARRTEGRRVPPAMKDVGEQRLQKPTGCACLPSRRESAAQTRQPGACKSSSPACSRSATRRCTAGATSVAVLVQSFRVDIELALSRLTHACPFALRNCSWSSLGRMSQNTGRRARCPRTTYLERASRPAGRWRRG